MEVNELSMLDLALAELPRLPAKNPIAFRDELRAACFRAVMSAFNPIGFAETMLARDIARRGAQLLCDEQRQDAAEEQTVQAMAAVLTPTAKGGAEPGLRLCDLRLLASERLDALARAELRNSNAFFLRLRQLKELQRDRNPGQFTWRDRDPRFDGEGQCILYLARRFRLGGHGCRQCCQVGAGSWLAARRCWQCSKCNTQTCHRHGTVMERSHVPLANWFHAISIALCCPSISAADLAVGIGIRRVSTVKKMLGKIRTAMLADNASQLLAGLDTVYMSAC